MRYLIIGATSPIWIIPFIVIYTVCNYMESINSPSEF